MRRKKKTKPKAPQRRIFDGKPYARATKTGYKHKGDAAVKANRMRTGHRRGARPLKVRITKEEDKKFHLYVRGN